MDKPKKNFDAVVGVLGAVAALETATARHRETFGGSGGPARRRLGASTLSPVRREERRKKNRSQGNARKQNRGRK